MQELDGAISITHAQEHQKLDHRIAMLEVQMTLGRWFLALLVIAAVTAAVQRVSAAEAALEAVGNVP